MEGGTWVGRENTGRGMENGLLLKMFEKAIRKHIIICLFKIHVLYIYAIYMYLKYIKFHILYII